MDLMKSFLFYKVWHYSVYRIKPKSLLYPVVPVELLRTSARGRCPYTVEKDKMLWDYTKFAMIKKGKDWITPWNHVLQSFLPFLELSQSVTDWSSKELATVVQNRELGSELLIQQHGQPQSALNIHSNSPYIQQ